MKDIKELKYVLENFMSVLDCLDNVKKDAPKVQDNSSFNNDAVYPHG